jgi:acyl-CoA ligase (AMP-forming) (exosortase A-associated)
MNDNLAGLLLETANRQPERTALEQGAHALTYGELAAQVQSVAHGLVAGGLVRGGRVGVYLAKQTENVVAMFATAAAGGAFVPVNPVLKAAQVAHILDDCSVEVLVTSRTRLRELRPVLSDRQAIHTIVITDATEAEVEQLRAEYTPARAVGWIAWSALRDATEAALHRVIDRDLAAVLYTSGSTGKPKGVVLSHANMVAGARSVASYLANTSDDRLLAVLPFSFDYGFSQLSTAFFSGAAVVLLDYLLPRDVIRAIERHRITGLAAVPPLWIQLAALEWPESAASSLRYITNSGGAMPRKTLQALRQRLATTQVFLMYGLTEAFRSTFLPPEEIDRRPDSIGRAIPNAEVMVLRPDGSRCAPDEPGELVHRGALVSLGYWNDAERTARRFRPLTADHGSPLQEIVVWSGDTVRADADGYLYFVGRQDDMIKTSGYRVSPAEVEEEAYASGAVAEAAAVGVPHRELGAAIVLVCACHAGADADEQEASLTRHLRTQLPSYMQPAAVQWVEALPRNPNGKLDRTTLARQCRELFVSDADD